MTTPSKNGAAANVATPEEPKTNTSLSVIKAETKPENLTVPTVDEAIKKAEKLNQLLETRTTLQRHTSQVSKIVTGGLEKPETYISLQSAGYSYDIINPTLLGEVKNFVAQWIETKAKEVDAEILAAY